MKIIQIGNIAKEGSFSNHQTGRIYSVEGICPTLTTMGGGKREPKILVEEMLSIRQATQMGYVEIEQGGVFDFSYPDSKTRRGRSQDHGRICPTITTNVESSILRYEGMEKVDVKGNINPSGDGMNGNVFGINALSPTLTTNKGEGLKIRYRIRKLTPRECFRLMGVRDDDINKIQASGVSKSQQYKMAGNSIVVDNLYYIFRNMFTKQEKTTLF